MDEEDEDEDEDEGEGKEGQARDSKSGGGLKIGLSAPSARNPIKYRRYPRGEA